MSTPAEIADAKNTLLQEISARQGECAPVTIKIGDVVGGQVRHDCVVIIDAPPVILQAVMGMTARFAGMNASIAGGGLRVTFH